jgi:OOP family OmpA-OmpF porin
MNMRLFFGISLLILIAHNIYAQRINDLLSVNSSHDELNPVLSGDGQTLYFTIANHPANIGGQRDPGDIWYAKLVGDKWSVPVHAGNVINDRSYNAVAGFSVDGKSMFLLSHYTNDGSTSKTQGISVTTFDGKQWSKPVNISIPYYSNKSRVISGTLIQSKIFIFSAETYGSIGVDDIYVSTCENGKWSDPINLGATINTKFQELSPSLSEDGHTLYFSSNGRKGGFGSFDIYASTRRDDSWTSWSEPVNLGPLVNSEGRELFFKDVPSMGISIFTTTKNSDGYGDIKFVTPQDRYVREDSLSKVFISDTVKVNITVVDSTTNDHLLPGFLKVHGKILDSKTNAIITSAHIAFQSTDADSAATTSGENGYHVMLPALKSYSVKIDARGYVSHLEKFDGHIVVGNEAERNFSLQPIAVGTVVNLSSVLFSQGKAELLPESFDELDVVVSFLKENPHVKIMLSGHTDNRGVEADNIKLSQARVNTVKAYLVSKGIEPKRISGKGYGGSKPIASNEGEETRKLNRRVEFTIKKF